MKQWLTIALITLSFSCFAKQYKGYIIKLSGDTIDCQFDYATNWIKAYTVYEVIPYKGRLKPIINGEKKRYRPDELKGYGMFINNRWSHYVSMNTELCGLQFAKRRVSGALNLYSFFSIDPFLGGFDYYQFIQNNETKEINHLPEYGSRKEIIEYFDHCESVVQKIENQTYRLAKRDIWKTMLEDYNLNCN